MKQSKPIFSTLITVLSLVLSLTQVHAKTYFVHNDQLGTPQVITDNQQQTAWQAHYSPFGTAETQTDAITHNIRFPGQYYDSETGLHYNYFRYYDPSTGRYITSDPIGLQGGLNTYSYVEGNPVNAIDPLGLFTSPHHAVMSYNALHGQGFPSNFVYDAVKASVMIDFAEGSQSIESSHTHAMKQPGESDAKAGQKYSDYTMSEVRKCTSTGLGNAMHAVQDRASGSHGFKTYNGSVTYSHFLRDHLPTAAEQNEAVVRSRLLIEKYREICNCQ